MSKFKAKVTINLTIESPSLHHAYHAMRAARLTDSERVPLGPSYQVENWNVSVIPITPPDERFIAHLPNLSPSELRHKLSQLGDLELAVVSACANGPRSLHDLYSVARLLPPTGNVRPSDHDIAQTITRLKHNGWIIPVRYNVELDNFGDMADAQGKPVQAQFSALARQENTQP